MNETDTSPTNEPTGEPEPAADLPPGNHPLEVAARRGIGPLSPQHRGVWHGDARPCVSCGQLTLRYAAECDYCGQDLGAEMLEKMRTHAGPWYVLEHVRPFPGVSVERVIRQIRRGLITETSIVRGPATDHQWRFAVEAPGLCRYFAKCWSCHDTVSPSDTYCQHCLSFLSFEKPKSAPAVPPSAESVAAGRSRDTGQPDRAGYPPAGSSPPPTGLTTKVTASVEEATAVGRHAESADARADRLEQLSAVVEQGDLPAHEAVWDDPPRIAGIRATWVAVALLIVVVAALMFLTRTDSPETPPHRSAAPGLILQQL